MNGVESEEILDTEYLALAAEAALFACGSDLDFVRLSEAIGTSVEAIPQILHILKEKYDARKTAISLYILGDSAVFATKKEYAEVVKIALNLRKNQPLSRAALEVLAIVAYNQPTTRAFIDKVRGVESPSVVASVCEKGLIEEKGRLEAPGRPVLYGTTPIFLRTFGLNDISELVEIPEIAEYLAELNAQNQSEQTLSHENINNENEEIPNENINNSQESTEESEF